MKRIAPAVMGVAAALAMLMPVKAAQADPTTLIVNKCSSGKIKYEGKVAAGIGKCIFNAMKMPPDLCVILKLEAKSVSALAKLEKDPAACLATGDFTPPFVQFFGWDAFFTEVGAPPLVAFSKCDRTKYQCVGKYIAGLAGCYAKAAGKAPGTVDPNCISKSEDKFSSGGKGCFDKALAAADCSNPAGTADGLRSVADTFLITQVCTLNPGATPDCP